VPWRASVGRAPFASCRSPVPELPARPPRFGQSGGSAPALVDLTQLRCCDDQGVVSLGMKGRIGVIAGLVGLAMHVSQFDGLAAAVEPGQEAIDPQFAAKWMKPPVAEALAAVVVTFVSGMTE
jgi:hypothetical protein